MTAADFYFERFGFCPPQIAARPHPDLSLAVVIPCFNEPELCASLQSLWDCEHPAGAVEIIVVINAGEDAPAAAIEQNQRTLARAEDWVAKHQDSRFRFHLLHFPGLKAKHAGVGLARKIGMDEALRRFQQVGRIEAPILCFDADSRCDPNYLAVLEKYFTRHPESPGCSIYFEHPLEGADDPRVYEGVTWYELHLRYYVEALRFAKFPHAFHTIGSSMAVRANAYLKQGGMNKRKAGEDFYFLHKIIPLGNFGEVNDTRIIPSPRPSDRVPFGTGRAVREYLQAGRLESYALRAFEDLGQFFACVPGWFQSERSIASLPEPLAAFLATQNATEALKEIRANTASLATFQRRFFRWFDGFRAMKFIHFARDQYYGAADLIADSSRLAARIGCSNPPTNTRDLLQMYRTRQRKACAGAFSGTT